MKRLLDGQRHLDKVTDFFKEHGINGEIDEFLESQEVSLMFEKAYLELDRVFKKILYYIPEDKQAVEIRNLERIKISRETFKQSFEESFKVSLYSNLHLMPKTAMIVLKWEGYLNKTIKSQEALQKIIMEEQKRYIKLFLKETLWGIIPGHLLEDFIEFITDICIRENFNQ